MNSHVGQVGGKAMDTDGRSTASIDRRFLDWSAPLVPQAAGWLVELAEAETELALPQCVDLRGTLCVLPGRRAGRLLLDELLTRCRQSGRGLLPPSIATPGPAVDLLLESTGADDRAVAEPVTAELAWMEALRGCPNDALATITAARPADDDWPQWFDLAMTISRLHDAIAGARCTFEMVAERAERRELLGEGDRWRALHIVHELYQQVLERNDFIDVHDHRERALKRLDRLESITRVVLIGVVDLNVVQRAAVMRAASLVPTSAVIHAPQQWADHFDETGCVVAERWRDVVIDHDAFTLLDCDRPGDQARRVIETIAGWEGRYAADEISIGLGDESLAGPIERSAQWAGLSMHHASGQALSRSGPYRLLSVIADWLSEPRFAHFASLVRHPDLERWLRSRAVRERDVDRGLQQWLTLLDEYFAAHLQQKLDGKWLGSSAQQQGMRAVYQCVNGLLQPLAGQPRRLGQWSAPLLDVLRCIYRPSEAENGRPRIAPVTARACEALREAVADLDRGDASLQPIVSAGAALRLLLMRCGPSPVADNPRDDQIEMLGWLELHTDPAPALIVSGVNEGAVPSSANADLFLPDALRRELGLPSNDTRYARDAYYMTAVPRSRQHTTVLTGRRAANDEPLTPSRLLLTGDDETLLRHAEMLCCESDATDVVIPVGLRRRRSETAFDVPGLPDPIEPPTHMSITDFRLYLQCPYRFALRRLLKLGRVTDDASELDPLQFGNLLHRVLQMFGNDPELAGSSSPEVIERALVGMLDDLARTNFGATPVPSVRIQLSAARRRLQGFARAQAELRRAGWEIVHAEHTFDQDVALDVPNDDPMPLTGRIDRIDVHAADGTWRVIDYKTSEKDASPISAHHGRKTLPKIDVCAWQDLQLPLYDYIIRRSGLIDRDARIQLGYIVLPRDSRNVSFIEADWTGEHLQHAVLTAQEIVQKIRAGQYERNPNFNDRFDDFARLCHTEFFASFASDEDDDEVSQ